MDWLTDWRVIVGVIIIAMVVIRLFTRRKLHWIVFLILNTSSNNKLSVQHVRQKLVQNRYRFTYIQVDKILKRLTKEGSVSTIRVNSAYPSNSVYGLTEKGLKLIEEIPKKVKQNFRNP